MKQRMASAFLVILSVLLQSTIFDAIRIAGTVPDLALLILIYTALRTHSMTAQVVGFFGGLLEDILSLAPLGFSAFSKTMIGYLVGKLEGRVIMDSFFFPMVTAASAVIIKNVISFLLALIVDPGIKPSIFISWRLLVEIPYTAFLAPFVFSALKRLFDYFEVKKASL